MEESYPNLFASGISNEHTNNDIGINFDTITESFDCLYDQMLSGAKFLDDNVFDSGISFPVAADVGLATPGFSGLVGGGGDDDGGEVDREQNSGEGGSSGMQMKPKSRDRSKTLVSERKRRGHMKEKLYKLRSLVPNITKMDKASIVADAVAYLQNLQNQAKRLVEEISVLESSLREDPAFRAGPSVREAQLGSGSSSSQCGWKIMEVLAREVAEGRFYVKVVSDKGGYGIASALHRAIESLEGRFEMESSRLSFDSGRFVLAATLNVNINFFFNMNVIDKVPLLTILTMTSANCLQVRGLGEGLTNASAMKMWVMDALLKEGLGFDMSLMPAV